jgi:hypothetical protein
LDFGENAVTLVINHKPVGFNYEVHLASLKDVQSVWQLDVGLSWMDGSHAMHMQRSAYMIR